MVFARFNTSGFDTTYPCLSSIAKKSAVPPTPNVTTGTLAAILSTRTKPNVSFNNEVWIWNKGLDAWRDESNTYGVHALHPFANTRLRRHRGIPLNECCCGMVCHYVHNNNNNRNNNSRNNNKKKKRSRDNYDNSSNNKKQKYNRRDKKGGSGGRERFHFKPQWRGDFVALQLDGIDMVQINFQGKIISPSQTRICCV